MTLEVNKNLLSPSHTHSHTRSDMAETDRGHFRQESLYLRHFNSLKIIGIPIRCHDMKQTFRDASMSKTEQNHWPQGPYVITEENRKQRTTKKKLVSAKYEQRSCKDCVRIVTWVVRRGLTTW